MPISLGEDVDVVEGMPHLTGNLPDGVTVGDTFSLRVLSGVTTV